DRPINPTARRLSRTRRRAPRASRVAVTKRGNKGALSEPGKQPQGWMPGEFATAPFCHGNAGSPWQRQGPQRAKPIAGFDSDAQKNPKPHAPNSANRLTKASDSPPST